MSKHDWNPELYLAFGKERIQPSIDLVARIDYEHPQRIIDIGCGPGNSTQVLQRRWTNSEIIGADNSPAMIRKASEDYPHQKWIMYDAGKDSLDQKFDIVFSNATIQWIPDHEKLIREFYELLNERGVLAIQVPLFNEMPLGVAISEIARLRRWSQSTEGADNTFTIRTASYYYDQLSRYFTKIDLWTTDYYHVMESHSAILEMIRSTGLRPYLERLSDENERKEFEALVFDRIKLDYPLQINMKVLFPFKRLFFVAKK
jgi:trans-aconitate 2-methyltransferase